MILCACCIVVLLLCTFILCVQCVGLGSMLLGKTLSGDVLMSRGDLVEHCTMMLGTFGSDVQGKMLLKSKGPKVDIQLKMLLKSKGVGQE